MSELAFTPRTSGPLWRKIEQQQRQRAAAAVQTAISIAAIQDAIDSPPEGEAIDPAPDTASTYVCNWRRILAEVAEEYEVTCSELLSPRRNKYLVTARHDAYWRLMQRTRFSLAQIGKVMGGRDHTTIWHGLHKHALLNGLKYCGGYQHERMDRIKLAEVG